MQRKLAILQGIFREVLDDPALAVTADLDMKDCPDWDSVATVQILLAVEAQCDIRISTADAGSLHCVSQLLDLMPD